MKRVRKGRIAVFGVMIMFACAVVYGGGQRAETAGEKGKQVTVSFLSWETEQNMKPFLDGLAAEEPTIKIDFQYAPPVGDYTTKLQTMLVSEAGPDIFLIIPENFNDMLKGQYIVDLTDQSFMNGLAPSNKVMYTDEKGRSYGYNPMSWVGGIFYNKKFFEETGISGEPQTWQDFLDSCGKLKKNGILPYRDSMRDAAKTIVTALVRAITISKNPNFDADVLSGKAKYADGWTQPFKLWYEGMVNNGYHTPDNIGITEDQVRNEFATENTAMVQDGIWAIDIYSKLNPDLNYSVMGVPGTQANTRTYFGAGGIGYSIYSRSKVREAALKFLKFMASPGGLEAYHRGTSQIITAKGYKHEVDARIKGGYEALINGWAYHPMSYWKKHSEALRVQYLTSLQDCMLGKITPEQAALSLDKKFEELEKVK